jgi:hypothetical protein
MTTFTNSIDPRQLGMNDTDYFQKQRLTASDATSRTLDTDWAKGAFLISDKDNGPFLEDIDLRNRHFSSAFFKFEDTTLGGSKCINPQPQFTRYADTRTPGILQSRQSNRLGNYSGNVGMGRYYSEAIHDNQQLVYMRFGVPQFNSLTTFFTGFYNNSVAQLAKSGRTDNFFFNAGVAIGKIIGLTAQVLTWQVTAALMVGRVFKWAFNKDTSKFYYLKPTMLTYWSTVNNLVNTIGVNKGLFPQVVKSALNKASKDQRLNDVFGMDADMLATLHKLMPDVFSETGAIDMYAAANKAQRIANLLNKNLMDQYDTSSYSDFYGFVQKVDQLKLERVRASSGSTGSITGIFAAIERFLQTEPAKPRTVENGKTTDGFELDVRKNPQNPNEPAPYPDTFANFLEAEMNDGSAYACFRVDYTGSVSESFSNSVGENELQGKLNSMSGSARQTTFSFAGGKLDDGIIGSAVGAAVDVAKGVATGVLDSLHLTGLMSLAGNAFVDIPKHWQSSAASLPRSTYTMTLISPYGNTISQMFNIYIPMAMLLAGALPLSTGKQSWTSPFILEMFDQGRAQTRLGMIDSLSFTRGTANLGFNKAKSPMAVDVSFSVVDMSSVMHLQIGKGWGDAGEGVFDDDTVFSDYMAILGSLGVYEQFNKLPKALIKSAAKLRGVEALTSKSRWAMFLHERTPVGALDIFYRGSSVQSSSVAR